MQKFDSQPTVSDSNQNDKITATINGVSSKKIPSGDTVVIFNVTLTNNETVPVYFSASLEDGKLLDKNAETMTETIRKINYIIFSTHVKFSSNSFGTNPVKVDSQKSVTGDFVFRIPKLNPASQLVIEASYNEKMNEKFMVPLLCNENLNK